MTAPALPPEVERALVAAIDAVDDAANGHITNAQSCAAEDALRTAIARALGGDGEPVAWGLTDGKAGQVLEPLFTNVSAAEAAARRTGFLTVVPLYLRPAATGDTGEGEKAARRCLIKTLEADNEIAVGDVQVYPEMDPSDGSTQYVVDDPKRERRFDTPEEAIDALLAATGGPDAR